MERHHNRLESELSDKEQFANVRRSQNATELKQNKNYLQKIDDSIKSRKNVLAKLQALKMIDNKQNLAPEPIIPKDKYDSIKYRLTRKEGSQSPESNPSKSPKRFHPSTWFNMRYDPTSVTKANRFYDAIEESSKEITRNVSPIRLKKSSLDS